jgi:hypothetical protein
MIMRTIINNFYIITLFTFFFFLSACHAQNEIKYSLQVDLDKDGKPETVALKKHKQTDEGSFYHLVVYKNVDGKKKVLWEDKKVKYEFCEADWGIEDLEIAGDVYKDGNIELFTPYAMSDVSPVSYRIFKWTDNQFIQLKDACYITQLKTGDKLRLSGIFRNDMAYSTGEKDFSKMAWIDDFEKLIEPGVVEVNITGYDDENNVLLGKAIVQSTGDGFKLVKWLEELHN